MSAKRRRGRPKASDQSAIQIDEVFIDTTCDVCNAEFVDFEDLLVHKDQVHPKSLDSQVQYIFNGYDCHFCQETHQSLDQLSLHIRDDHLYDISNLCCVYCLRIFKDLRKMKTHEQLHLSTTKQNVFSCTYCPVFMNTTRELQKHDFEAHKDVKDGVLVYECLPFLTAQLNMRADVFLKALGKHMQTYTCICNFKTSEMMEHLHHLRSKRCRSVVCGDCCRPYLTLKNLKKHIGKRSCTNQGATKRCDDCQANVPVAEFESHDCIKPSKCEICFKEFRTASDLEMHMRFKLNHLPRPKLSSLIIMKKCFYCNLELFNLRVYKNHVEKCHKDYKNYKYECVYCVRTFNHPQKLFGHLYSQHKDVLPFRCNICEKDFRVRRQFTVHIKVAHNSVGFVEFTEQFNVHFNKEKSVNAFQPVPKEKLFTDEEMEEFKEAGLDKIPSKPKVKAIKRVAASESSDDEPLIKKRNVTQINKLKGLATRKKKSPRLTCKICTKYCYTVQNYNRHVAQHFKEKLSCVKCERNFPTKKAMDRHLEATHATAPITQKLKSLLERKRLGQTCDLTQPMSKRFETTVKKVPKEVTPSAVIKEVKESAKNFLETFTPEASQKIEISASVTIRQSVESRKPFALNIVRCDLTPLSSTRPQLRMPEKVNLANDFIKVKVRLQTQPPSRSKPKLNFGVREDEPEAKEVPEVAEEVEFHIGEVAEEVHAETRSDPPEEVSELIIPDLPEEHGTYSIATLQSEAPYFRITPLDKLLNKTIEDEYQAADEIQLPTGTLVRTNPLAHLMRGTDIDLTPRYYAPKLKNPQKALANALMKLADSEERSMVKRKVVRATKVNKVKKVEKGKGRKGKVSVKKKKTQEEA